MENKFNNTAIEIGHEFQLSKLVAILPPSINSMAFSFRRAV